MAESGSPLSSRIRSTVIRGSVVGAMLRAICQSVRPCATVTRAVGAPWAWAVVAPAEDPHGPIRPTPIATTKQDVLTTNRPRRVSRTPPCGTRGGAAGGLGDDRRMGCGGTHAASRRGRLRHPDKHSPGPRPRLGWVVRVHRVVLMAASVASRIEHAFELTTATVVLHGTDKVTTRSNMCLNNVLTVTTVGLSSSDRRAQIVGHRSSGTDHRHGIVGIDAGRQP